MTERQERGQAAEDLACAYLSARGLSLLERNYRCTRGEIDLIMRDAQGATVFVEVRLRRDTRFGGALASIDHRKQGRLAATALHYLQRHTALSRIPCRFDVVCVTPPSAVEWIANAFEVNYS